MKQIVFIIISSPDGVDLKTLNVLKSKDYDIRLYIDNINTKNRISDFSEFNIKETDRNTLNNRIAADFKKQSSRSFILFDQEISDNKHALFDSIEVGFYVTRFCPFSFLSLYRYGSPAEVEFAQGAEGYFAKVEKRIFNPGEDPPLINYLYGQIPVVANPTKKTAQLLFNRYYSLAAISARAEKVLADALSPVAPSESNYFDLALYHLSKHSYSQARWSITQCLSNKASNPLLKFVETYIYQSAKDAHNLQRLQTDLETNYLHKFPEAAFLLSQIADQSGHRQQAKQILYSIHKKLPEYPAVLQKLGQILIEEKDYQQALEYINKCLQLDPYNYISLLDFSQLMIMARKFDQALPAIERAQQSPACESRAYLQLASIYKQTGQIKQTIDCLQKFLVQEQSSEIDPKNLKLKTTLDNIRNEIKTLSSGK